MNKTIIIIGVVLIIIVFILLAIIYSNQLYTQNKLNKGYTTPPQEFYNCLYFDTSDFITINKCNKMLNGIYYYRSGEYALIVTEPRMPPPSIGICNCFMYLTSGEVVYTCTLNNLKNDIYIYVYNNEIYNINIGVRIKLTNNVICKGCTDCGIDGLYYHSLKGEWLQLINIKNSSLLLNINECTSVFLDYYERIPTNANANVCISALPKERYYYKLADKIYKVSFVCDSVTNCISPNY